MGHSETFRQFYRAILERKQITCIYQERRREICPHILGHKDGAEAALVFQFGGASSRQLPLEGEWRCLLLSKVEDVKLRDGRWYSGGDHRTRQRCVHDVFADVNTDVPNQPGRR